MLGETRGISRETRIGMGISKGGETKITTIRVELKECITARSVTTTTLVETVRESK